MKGLLADPVDAAIDEPLSCPANWRDPPDTERARHALKFIQNCPHTKGDLRRQGKTMGDTWLWWQERLTRHLFGEIVDGLRRYQTAYVEMPKKAGKSHWLAAAMLYLGGPGTQPGAELYSAAYDHGQAKIVWDIARTMCEIRDPHEERFEIRNYQGCWEIENPVDDSTYEPLTRKAASKHGFNPYAVAFDELHAQPDRGLWDTIDGSMGSWDEPLLIAITNSGYDRQSICYKQREKAIANNEEPYDDSFLGVVYGVEQDLEGVGTEEDWQRANPGVPVTVNLSWVRTKAVTAERQPSAMDSFRRWQLGIWTSAETRFFDRKKWDDCGTPVVEEELRGRPCYGGLDLASKVDIAALVWVFEDEPLPVLPRLFIPEATIEKRSRADGVPYRAWEKQGLVIATPGEVIDYAWIRGQIISDADKFDVQEIAFDPWGANQLTQELDERGLTMVPHRQGYKSMSEPTKELGALVQAGRIAHGGHDAMTWMADNLMVTEDPSGNIKPSKSQSTEKIDGMVALIMAIGRWVRHETQKSEPDLFVLG